jgi:hypothetical protein
LYVPDDPTSDSEKLSGEIKAWVNDFNAQPSISQALADKGYDATAILRSVWIDVADRIDAIDRRIVSLQSRRDGSLEIERELPRVAGAAN